MTASLSLSVRSSAVHEDAPAWHNLVRWDRNADSTAVRRQNVHTASGAPLGVFAV